MQTNLLATAATIGISVYAHGLTAQPLTKRYVHWWESHPREPTPMESVPTPEHRLRVRGRGLVAAGDVAEVPQSNT